MKVMIELPDGWLDEKYLNNLEWMSRTVKDEVKAQLVKAVAEQVHIPQLMITAEELKPLVLDKLATMKANEVND